jgi:methionine-rich copper-binding protein CopC
MHGLLLVALAAGLAPDARAHAQLEQSTPAAGSRLRESPAQLTLQFSQRFEPAFSRIRVLDSKGNQVDHGNAQVGGSGARLLQVSLPRLEPGSYQVEWRVLSVDTHVSEGRFTFDVRP